MKLATALPFASLAEWSQLCILATVISLTYSSKTELSTIIIHSPFYVLGLAGSVSTVYRRETGFAIAKGKEEIDLTIGANLKRLRLSKNMSQADLAKAVSVTQPMIAQIERGTKSLTMELGREISEVLEVPIDALLEDSTKQTV